MDLNKVIQTATAEYICSDGFQNVVKESVKKMIDDKINDSLKSYGDIAKSMEEYIKKECVLNISDLPAIGLNKLMIETIDEELNILLRSDLKERIVSRVAAITEPMPKEVTLMELLQKIYSEKTRFDACYCGDGSEEEFENSLDYNGLDSVLSFYLEDDKDGYFEIWIDDNTDVKKDHCDYHIGIHKERGHIVFYNGAGNRFGINNEKPLNRFYGVSSCLYKLQVQDSTINVNSVQEFIDNYL